MTDIKHHTPEIDDKMGFELEHVEKDVPVTASATATPPSEVNLAYSEEDVEPEIHLRTYLALFALFLLNVVQVVGLTGPPSMVSLIVCPGK